MRRVILISGAGLSVESGIRAFRTETKSGKSLWDEYDVNEVCDINAFRGDFYHKTHSFYNKRREELSTVHPNAAHLQIGEWFNKYPGQVINISTNVDDLLERSGIPRDEVIHVHGFLKELRYKLNEGDEESIVDIGYTQIEPDDYHWAKPNVVFFGEAAPLYADMYNMFDSLTSQDMVIVVGCSNQVINFNWDLFPSLSKGVKMLVVNNGINYLEQEFYENNGVLVYYAGAVETFTNKNFIKLIEKHLEG